MTEKKLQIKVIIALFIVFIFSSLYAWGGMEHKYLRRFVAPIIYFTSISILYKDKTYFWRLPIACLMLSMGYGADVLAQKIIRRFVFAILNSIVFLPSPRLEDRKWIISSGFHIIFVVCLHMIFGILSLLPARAEEALLGAGLVLIPSLMIPKEEGGKIWERQ